MREEQPSAPVSEPTTTHCRVTSRDTRPRSLSFLTKIAPNGSPSPNRPGLFSHRGNTGQKAFFWPAWAPKSKGRPNSLDGRPNEGWAREWPKLRRTSLEGVSICKQISTGLTLDESPRTGYQGSLKAIQLTKTESHSLTREWSEITRGLGGYTRWVHSHAPSCELKYPPGNSARITWGLGGYTRRVRSRAPSGELTLASQNTPR